MSSIFGLSGSYHFLILYFGAGFVSSLPALLKHKDNIHYNAVGASGAVSAVIYAFVLLHPLEFISVFFIPMPAILFGIIYLAVSYYMAKKNVDNIGHDAHFWGAVFGFVYPILIKPELFMIFLSQLKF
ncbi:MAG: rhomboid family intramembrane serine protease [Bacteroidales bacterium]|nr:rhomboid family intramembrane serine protease [Bacteroidales bacterium]